VLLYRLLKQFAMSGNDWSANYRFREIREDRAGLKRLLSLAGLRPKYGIQLGYLTVRLADRRTVSTPFCSSSLAGIVWEVAPLNIECSDSQIFISV
jgi:hypothetical protein